MAVNLVVDEVSIRHLDYCGGQEYGYTDLGCLMNEESDEAVPMATSNLTFLAVNLKENYRIPVAYFLIDSL